MANRHRTRLFFAAGALPSERRDLSASRCGSDAEAALHAPRFRVSKRAPVDSQGCTRIGDSVSGKVNLTSKISHLNSTAYEHNTLLVLLLTLPFSPKFLLDFLCEKPHISIKHTTVLQK